MADTPEVQAEQGVPFDQDEWDAYWEKEDKRSARLDELFRESGDQVQLNCGDPPLLNPNGSLMLDENGNEMYAKGQSGPPEDPDE